jgi:minor extracellular serine protease Vpr
MKARTRISKITNCQIGCRTRRWLLLPAVLALAALLSPQALRVVEAQSADPASRFARSPVSGKFIPKFPLRRPRELTVVLKLVDDPVAVVRSRLPGKRITAGQRTAIAQNLRVQQDTLAAEVQARGGQVLARFQHAINGLKVRGTPEQIAAWAKLPGVVAVKAVGIHKLHNATSVPFIGAPAVWQGPPGLHGENIKIAIIDTGIDYTHANFGGPGTEAAYDAAFATSTQPADPTMFGPNAPKVKGGIDLVGDDYDAVSDDPARRVPHPDPNPLDCDSHGSHVAGTAAGFGVTASGAAYTGPYDGSTPGTAFRVGPGVAPLAELYAIRVFGCQGSTDVTLDAIDWSVQNDMQVINMSLGSSFGIKDTADAEASDNAVDAGIVVVASSGNSGQAPYITSSPATGEKVISVAAMHSSATFPAVSLTLNTGQTIIAQNSNAATITNNTVLPVFVLRDNNGDVSLGCDESEYVDAQIAGKLVVTRRGQCDRPLRAIYGQRHGAAAVAMINSSESDFGGGYPPLEAPIPGVTIPFLGVRFEDGPALVAAATATLSDAGQLPDPTFRKIAAFSSGGPRWGDGHLKPDLIAPGVGITSTGRGTGINGFAMAGTSMAAPHVAGVAALAIQAHPDWDADQVATAIVNTADPLQLVNYSPRLAGSGLVQPSPATRTSVIARSDHNAPSVNFGVKEFSHNFSDVEEVTVRNLGTRSASFTVSATKDSGSSSHSVNVFPTTVSVSPGQTRNLHVALNVPAATVGDADSFRDVAGFIKLTPTNSTSNGGAALLVPYYLVPRARSEILAVLQRELVLIGEPNAVRVANTSLSLPGTADFYAWGLRGEDHGHAGVDLRAVGVQSLDSNDGKLLVFAVNTFAPWSNAARSEYDVLLDINGDGTDDFIVLAADLGLLTGNPNGPNGQMASAVFNISTGELLVRFLAVAPTDGNTLLIPALASDVGVTPANPRFSYAAQSYDLFGDNFSIGVIEGPARFNAFDNAISTGAFVTVGPLGQTSVPISINRDEWQVTPALGVMVVSLDNFNRGLFAQTQLLPVRSGL